MPLTNTRATGGTLVKLGQRDLPKTGNIDELIERLVDADTQ
jgi:hypothetical protein